MERLNTLRVKSSQINFILPFFFFLASAFCFFPQIFSKVYIDLGDTYNVSFSWAKVDRP